MNRATVGHWVVVPILLAAAAGRSATAVESHDSSKGMFPDCGTPQDISAAGIPALRNSSSPSLTRGPYLQMPSPNGIVVRWRSTTPTDSRVRYGPAPGSLGLSFDVPGQRIEHEVTLSGLDPDTRYFYSVGTTTSVLAGGDDEHVFRTAPLPGSDQPLRIWVIGDSGTANASAAAVRDAYESFTGDVHTNLWLMLGDNAYQDGTDEEYQAAVFDMYPRRLRQSGLWSTLGNHDGHSASSGTQSGPYYNIFSLPTAGEVGGVPSGTEAYYSFDFGNIHFICLNSYDVDRAPGSTMLTWLEHDLMNTVQDWTVAFWHHPPYSKGSHDSDSEGRMSDMRENALPILEAGGPQKPSGRERRHLQAHSPRGKRGSCLVSCPCSCASA